MKLEVILKCARPVLFENDDEIYNYSIGGTCFIVLFKDRYFVITAKHVLKNFTPDQVRVQYQSSNPIFLPFDGVFYLKQLNDDDDCFDLAIFSVPKELIDDELFEDQPPYNLLEIDKFTIYSERSKYIYNGFPIEHRKLDWIEKHISHCAILGQGEYAGVSESSCCHKLQTLNLETLESFDGFSGSPVFQINHDDDKYSREAFAGMFIRGTRESGMCHYIGNARIIEMLKNIVNGDYSDIDSQKIV